MGSRLNKKKMNVEGDRLSNLPDDLIHIILSFVSIKDAIRTSYLSSRWRFMWRSLPYLNFSTKDVRTLPEYTKFVTNILSHHNDQIELSSVKLTFRGKISHVSIQKIMNYAFSHNVQQLDVTCLPGNNIEIPLSVFSCQSLKHLTLTGDAHRDHSIRTQPTWDLPALETLCLQNVNFCDDNTHPRIDIFSNCTNLKNLTLKKCSMSGSNCLSINHLQLSNLTLEDIHKYARVVAPQLKNLTIRSCLKVHLASLPNLASLLYIGAGDSQLSTKGFRSLEKANIRITHFNWYKPITQEIISLLQQLHTVKFLTLNLELVEKISSSVELISHQPSPFANLKSLKIYPFLTSSDEKRQQKVTLSTKVKNYLLGSSPGVTFTMVSNKEIGAFRNAVSAQNCMAELRVILDEEKAKVDTETNITTLLNQVQPMEKKLEPVQRMQMQIQGKMEQIKSCLSNFSQRIDQGSTKTCRIVSKLREIEVLLLKDLPTSKRDKLQARFSSLRAEVDTLVKEITDGMKKQWDEKHKLLLNNCFSKF